MGKNVIGTRMKTIAQTLRKAKVGDILRAGRRKWIVNSVDQDGLTIAYPANKATKFELWSSGIENAAIIPGLKLIKSNA